MGTIKSTPQFASAEKAFRHYMPGDPPVSGCWIWAGPISPQWGYGTFYFGGRASGRRLYAHRVSYEIFNGPIAPGLFVMHEPCDNPPCVNPLHLVAGTQAENLAAMRSRNREAMGLRNGNGKLPPESVDAIRARWASRPPSLTQAALGAEYGIAQAQVSRIVNRKQRTKG